MLAQDQKQIRKYGLQYSSKFFAASTVAMIAISSYCIIYGWKRFENIFLPFSHKIDRFSSALILSSATFAVFSLTLLISYGVFKYRNRNNYYNKEAGKIINNETKSVSGKMLISTSAIGAFVLACAILTASVNNRDVLSAMSRAFGFSKNGSWIGGLGGLLLCFIVSSLAVFAVSSVISFCFKGKNHRLIGDDELQKQLKRYGVISQQVHGDKDAPGLIYSYNNEKNRTKVMNNHEVTDQTPKKTFKVNDIDFSDLEKLSNSQLNIAISALERRGSNASNTTEHDDPGQLDPDSDNDWKEVDKTCNRNVETTKETELPQKQGEATKPNRPVPPPRTTKTIKYKIYHRNFDSWPVPSTDITSATVRTNNKDAEEACQNVNVKDQSATYTKSTQLYQMQQ